MTDQAQTDLRLWTCTDHDGRWPVPVASIVLAPNEDKARELLAAKLRENGLKPERGFALDEHPIVEGAHVLSKGDY